MFRPLLPAALAACLALPALAGNITVTDAYVRSSGPAATSAGAYMTIRNDGPADDRLLSAATDAAAMAQLHTSETDANGVTRMIHVEAGFPVPAGGTLSLARGGQHVMLMGLSVPLEPDATVPITLVFERAGAVSLDLPVDQTR